MSTTTTPTQQTSTTTAGRKLWQVAVLAGLLAAGATTAVAALAHAAGVSLDVADEPIPVLAFAQMTFLFSMVGLAIAAGLRRWTSNPRQAWLRTTAVLLLVSLVPDLLADAATGTRLLLMSTHLVAAAIVVPVIAAGLGQGSRLPRS